MKNRRNIRMLRLLWLLCGGLLLGGCQSSARPAASQETSTAPVTTTTPATTEAAPVHPTPTALTPVIENENEIVSRLIQGTTGMVVDIGQGETIELCYYGWPTVCRGEGSTLYAAASLRISHIDPFGLVVFFESHDNGLTWSEPVVVADSPLDDRDSGILYLGDGKIMVCWFSHNASLYWNNDEYTGWKDLVTEEQKLAVRAKWDELEKTDPESLLGGSFTSVSADGGKTWSEPSRIPLTAPHGMTLGQDGQTIYFFGAPAANANLAGYTLASGFFYLFQSENGEETWTQVGAVELPTDIGEETRYYEGYCIQLQNGTFLAGIRTQNSIYGNWTVLTTKSEDGTTWSKPSAIQNANGKTYLNGSPPHFLQLKSGVIVLAYTNRTIHVSNRCGSRARLSYDNGETWSKEFVICSVEQRFNSDLGYPSTVELEDGTLLTTYYQAYGDDPYPSLLYTRWRLDEVTDDVP